MNTSDQPSFNSVHFSPSIFAEALRSSDISPVPILYLQPDTLGATSKKISNLPYKNFVGATQKKKI
jgi:hypothetical protein